MGKADAAEEPDQAFNEEKQLPLLARLDGGTEGFYRVSWSTTHICTPGLPCNPGEGERGRALRCALALGMAAGGREPWPCQPAPRYRQLTPHGSRSSPNLQGTSAAPLSNAEELGAVCSPALPSAAEGAFAPVPEKTEGGMETDLGLQNNMGQNALAKN